MIDRVTACDFLENPLQYRKHLNIPVVINRGFSVLLEMKRINHVEIKNIGRRGLISDIDRIILNYRFVKEVLRYKAPIPYMQRVHYHSLSAYWLRKYFNVKIILDVDDWDFEHKCCRQCVIPEEVIV